MSGFQTGALPLHHAAEPPLLPHDLPGGFIVWAGGGVRPRAPRVAWGRGGFPGGAISNKKGGGGFSRMLEVGFVLQTGPYHHHVGDVTALTDKVPGTRVDPVEGVEFVGLRPHQQGWVEPDDPVPELLPAMFGGEFI